MRDQVREAERRCAALEARLLEAENAHRADQSSGGGGKNLEYLKQVMEKYISMDEGEEADALFLVISTFLQFDASTVQALQRARQRKAAAQRGIQGRLSLLF